MKYTYGISLYCRLFPFCFLRLYKCEANERARGKRPRAKKCRPRERNRKESPFFLALPRAAIGASAFASGPSFWRVLRACSCWCIKVFYDHLFVTSTTKLNSINKNTHIYIKIKLELLKPLKFSDWRSSNDHKICQTMLKTKALKPVFRRCNLHNFRIGWWHNLPNWMFSFN